MNWDDAKTFLAVATSGSFAAAARRLNITHPTVSRRVSRLESAIGARLVDRQSDGISITAAGEKLLPNIKAMEIAARRVNGVDHIEGGPTGTVRISCGSPIMAKIARSLPSFFSQFPHLQIELDDTEKYLNLSRREADIAIRSRVPESGALKVQLLTKVTYAIFGSIAYGPVKPFKEFDRMHEHRWVVQDGNLAHLSYMTWLRDKMGDYTPCLMARRRRIILDAVEAGVGLSILPTLEATYYPNLVQLSPVIPELTSDLFLVSHQQALAESRVRATWRWLKSITSP